MTIAEPIVRVRSNDLIAMGEQLRRQKKQALDQNKPQTALGQTSKTQNIGKIDRAQLKKVLDETGPFEENTLFIGLGDDGLPVLLDLENPVTGSIAFIGDQLAGKQPQLKVIAAAIEELHSPDRVKFAVITDNPIAWRDFKYSPNCLNVFSYYDANTAAFLEGVTNWAAVNHQSGQSIVLLVENVDKSMYLPANAKQNLLWLLRNGPENKVWPIVTANATAYRSTQMAPLRAAIALPVYGKMLAEDAKYFEYLPEYERRRGEFILRSNKEIVRFHAPGII
jgi:hypothetical protein